MVLETHIRLNLIKDPSDYSRVEDLGRVRNDERNRRFHIILTALQEYEAIHGDMYVPSRFVVPFESQAYSPALHGLRLGNRVQALRKKVIYKDWQYQRQLNDIGFPWHAQHKKKDKNFERFMRSIFLYRRYYYLSSAESTRGNINDIRYDFVVPSGSSKWPSELWGYHLGRKVVEIRRGLLFSSPRYRKILTGQGLEVVPHYAEGSEGTRTIMGSGNIEKSDNKENKKLTFGYIGEVGGCGAFGEASPKPRGAEIAADLS